MKLKHAAAALLLAVGAVFGASYWADRAPAALFAAASADPPEMVVLMYHAINQNEGKAGDYVIPPWELEADLKAIKEWGCETVTAGEIVAHVREGAPLPRRPVLITFDDGYYNNYLHAFPLLKKYNCKALISIITSETDKYSELNENRENYSHLTWEMIREMQESGLVEIGNHTYDLHHIKGRRGVTRQEGESKEAYFEAVGGDIKKAQDRIEEMTGVRPTVFAYPFGSYSEDSEELMASLGFEATLGSEGRVFRVGQTPETLVRIPRYNRSMSTSARKILEEVFGPP